MTARLPAPQSRTLQGTARVSQLAAGLKCQLLNAKAELSAHEYLSLLDIVSNFGSCEYMGTMEESGVLDNQEELPDEPSPAW